jgi:hypothetical protein
VFCYTSWRFYAFSRTNLLTRCHSVSSLFSAIFVFQKSYIGNILRIGQNKSQSSYFSWSVTRSKAETEGSQEAAMPPHGANHPQATPGAGVGPWSTSWRHPSAYIFPSMGKPKEPDQNTRNILQAATVIDARSGGIVGFCPQINHMKLNRDRRRLLLSPRVRVAPVLFPLYFLFFSNSRSYKTHGDPRVYIHVILTQPIPCLNRHRHKT